MIRKLMFRLLPVQVILAMVGSVNGIVSGLFAANFVGTEAMTAVGLYSPITMFLSAVSIMLVGGATILCSEYMGRHDKLRLKNLFSLDLFLSFAFALIITLILLAIGIFDLSGFLTKDPAVRPLLNSYLIGQAAGIIPLILGSQLSSFLLLENKGRRTFTASIVYIIFNLILNYLFVEVLKLQALGLALASSLGLWVFFLVQAEYFVTGGSFLKFSVRGLDFTDCRQIVSIGVPGALLQGYQMVRGFAVNQLVTIYVGSVGISAFTAANNLMGLVWGLPIGMVAVSRMLMGVSMGEEDRGTLTDIMRVVFRWFVPLMLAVDIIVSLCAVPLTMLFYQDPADPVFAMTVSGFRILPFCMPLSVVVMHFVCYGQASGKNGLVHTISLLDGVISVVAFSALLLPVIGMSGVYHANVINSVISTLVLVGYSCIKKRHFPRNMDDLMVIPDDFGAREDERIDISIRSMQEVVDLSARIHEFCLSRGVSRRIAYLSGLVLEEMAGNIITHGFSVDEKKHTIDVRVVCKNDEVILRIKDDCVPFNPQETNDLAETPESAGSAGRIGLRLVFNLAKEVSYQNMLGLNVLQMRI